MVASRRIATAMPNPTCAGTTKISRREPREHRHHDQRRPSNKPHRRAEPVDLRLADSLGLANEDKVVAEVAVGIGRHLRLTDEDITWLRRAALVHDLGKVAIPGGIL